mgnify:CR=1 FL=1
MVSSNIRSSFSLKIRSRDIFPLKFTIVFYPTLSRVCRRTTIVALVSSAIIRGIGSVGNNFSKSITMWCFLVWRQKLTENRGKLCGMEGSFDRE